MYIYSNSLITKAILITTPEALHIGTVKLLANKQSMQPSAHKKKISSQTKDMQIKATFNLTRTDKKR